jgi:hypothetical protein
LGRSILRHYGRIKSESQWYLGTVALFNLPS